jgi:hypothetical protein
MRFGRDISRGALGLPRFEPVAEKPFTVAQYLSSINYRTGKFSPEREYLEFTVTLTYSFSEDFDGTTSINRTCLKLNHRKESFLTT